LIVGGHDPPLVELNRAALARLRVESKLEVVRGAGHRFKEPGAMETAAHLARRWFERHLGQVTAA
jgi:dipeptidyl aminopeptidase/acylaminoacyl peptidase